MSATRLTSTFDRATWREVQEALKAMGHYNGTIDGLPNPRNGQSQTMQALQSFAKKENIPITDLFDPNTGVVSGGLTSIITEHRGAVVQGRAVPAAAATTAPAVAAPAPAPAAAAPRFNEAVLARHRVEVPTGSDAQALSFIAGTGQVANRDQVRDFQRLLNANGARLAEDGNFGPLSETAARTFLGTRIEQLTSMNEAQLQQTGLTASQRDQYVRYLDNYVRNDLSNGNGKMCLGSFGALTRPLQGPPAQTPVVTPQGEWVPLVERQGELADVNIARQIYQVQLGNGTMAPILRNTVTGDLRLPQGMVRGADGVGNSVARDNERTLMRAVADHGIRLGVEPGQAAPLWFEGQLPKTEQAEMAAYARDPRTGRDIPTPGGHQQSRFNDQNTIPPITNEGVSAGRSTLDQKDPRFSSEGAVYNVRGMLNRLTADGVITRAELTGGLQPNERGVVAGPLLRGVTGGATVAGTGQLATPTTPLEVGRATRGGSPVGSANDGGNGSSSGGVSDGGRGGGGRG